MNLKTQKWIIALGLVSWIFIWTSAYYSMDLFDRNFFTIVPLVMVGIFLLRFIFPFTMNDGTKVSFKRRMSWVFLEITPMVGISMAFLWFMVHYVIPSKLH